MQANELLGRTAGRDRGARQNEAVERAEKRGHAIGMTTKQEGEVSSRCRWSIFVSFSHVNIFCWRLQFGMLDGKVEDQDRPLARCFKKGRARVGASLLIGYFSDLDAGCN